MDQFIGKMLDNRYEILEKIGTGGMAIVYKAKCHRLNRLVAIKILKSDLAQDEDFRRRFNAESQAVAQLSHPNIVSVYDVSRGGDIEYIVMELIDGITLKQYMEKRGQLNWRESLHFITQIIRGLSHAHSRGIIHRDIKPQNIMVLRDGSVRVADFGIACLENSAQTLTQEALGSVHYISPEQAKGDRTDSRSDLYSAGVVLYEMLTGRLPFEGDSAVSVAIQHLSSIPLAPREIKEDIPEQLELICMKAMASDLEKRYFSADDMIADLEMFRKNPDINLDFELSDLRPEAADEPTQPIRVARKSDSVGNRRKTGEAPAKNSHSKQTILILIASILAILVAGTLFRSIFDSFEKNTVIEQYVVKSVLGLTVDEAKELEGIKGIFEIHVVGKMSSEDYPTDTIAKQDPAADEYRKGGSLIINVWVSTGEDIGEMPDVTNLTLAQATVKLKNLKEKYGLIIEAPEDDMQFSDEITSGCIISSIPQAGEPLKKGDAVHLTISKGPELKLVPVPNFVGQSFETVKQQLVDVWKLTCTDADVEMVYSDAPGGQIIWQSLPANSTATEWDSIKFQVSSGLSKSVKDVDIPLPKEEGLETVYVEIYVGSETEPQYHETIRCSDIYAHARLTGIGRQQIRVYFDGALDQSLTHYLDFD